MGHYAAGSPNHFRHAFPRNVCRRHLLIRAVWTPRRHGRRIYCRMYLLPKANTN